MKIYVGRVAFEDHIDDILLTRETILDRRVVFAMRMKAIEDLRWSPTIAKDIFCVKGRSNPSITIGEILDRAALYSRTKRPDAIFAIEHVIDGRFVETRKKSRDDAE